MRGLFATRLTIGHSAGRTRRSRPSNVGTPALYAEEKGVASRPPFVDSVRFNRIIETRRACSETTCCLSRSFHRSSKISSLDGALLIERDELSFHNSFLLVT